MEHRRIIKEREGVVMPHQRFYQTGNVIKITKEPLKARRYGFLLGSEHTVITPPEPYKNGPMGVWVNDKFGKPTFLSFFVWSWTSKVKRVRRNRK